MATVAEKPELESVEETVHRITGLNIGPVKNLNVQFKGRGGIVQFKARNGRGKSTLLNQARRLGGGDAPSCTVRDGELKGEFTFDNAKLVIGRSTRTAGDELTLHSFENRFEIGVLIDPKIADPAAADRKRIKELARLRGVKPAEALPLFQELVGGKEEFDRIVATREETNDIVTFASQVKRDCEKAGRAQNALADTAEGKARGFIEQTEGVDLEAACDAKTLQAVLQEATLDEDRLKSSSERNKQHNAKLADAKAALEKAKANYSGPSVVDAKRNESEFQDLIRTADAKVEAAKLALQKAEAKAAAVKKDSKHASRVRELAEQHEAAITQWELQTNLLPMAETSADEFDAARRAVENANEAVERGVVVRNALAAKAKAEQIRTDALAHRKRAAELMAAATGTSAVLTQLVMSSGGPLEINSDGRITTKTARGHEYYHDLSPGIRGTMAVKVALPAMTEESYLTLMQEVYDGIDEGNRITIAQAAEDAGVWILAAAISMDEEVTAEVLTGQPKT